MGQPTRQPKFFGRIPSAILIYYRAVKTETKMFGPNFSIKKQMKSDYAMAYK